MKYVISSRPQYSECLDFTGAWMPAPHVPNCPPGLEYLTQIDQIIVQQKVELLEGKVVIFHSVS